MITESDWQVISRCPFSNDPVDIRHKTLGIEVGRHPYYKGDWTARINKGVLKSLKSNALAAALEEALTLAP